MLSALKFFKDKESRVALIDIEDCVYELKNNKSIIFIKQKGSITSWLEDDNLYIIKNGEPFKWNIEMAEVIKKEKWGITIFVYKPCKSWHDKIKIKMYNSYFYYWFI